MNTKFLHHISGLFVALLCLVGPPTLGAQTVTPLPDSISRYLTERDTAGYLTALKAYCGARFEDHPGQTILYSMEALALLGDRPDRRTEAVFCNLLGISFLLLDQPDRSLEFLLRGSDLANQVGDDMVRAMIDNSIAGVYRAQGLYDEAMDYYGRALAIWDSLDLPGKRGIAYSNFGAVHDDLGEYEAAITYRQRAVREFTTAGDSAFIKATHLNIANGLVNQGDARRALDYLAAELPPSDRPGLSLRNRFSLHDIYAKAYLSLGRPLRALPHIRRAERLLPALASPTLEQIALDLYRQYYVATDRLDSAYHYLDRHRLLSDSLAEESTQWKLAQLRSSYELERERAVLSGQMTELEQRNAANVRGYVLLSVFALALFTVLYLWQRGRIRRNLRVIAEQRAELDRIDTTIAAKNSQLATTAVELGEKQDLLRALQQRIEGLTNQSGPLNRELNRLSNSISYNLTTDDGWHHTEAQIQASHPDFVRWLTGAHPDLTATEYKLCLLLRLDYSTQRIADILQLSPVSVGIYRSRVRKKFGLRRKDSLEGFVQGV